MRFPSFLPIAACLLIIQPLHAIPLRFLAWDNQVSARKLTLKTEKGVMKLDELHPLKRTRVYQITGSEELPPMIQVMDKPAVDGVPLSLPIKIPAGIKNPLLLLLPDEKSPSGLRQLVIEDSVSDFNWGTIRFVNASGKPLVFGWEKKLIKIPASWAPVNIAPGGQTRNMEVFLYLPEQPTMPVYSAVWEYREEFRQLVFLVPNPDQSESLVSFKFIVEDRRVVEADAKAEKSPGSAVPN